MTTAVSHYKGVHSTIHFVTEKDQKGVTTDTTVRIWTKDLYFKPVENIVSDRENCRKLFSHPTAMEKFGNGVKTTAQSDDWVENQSTRWANHDVYSAFLIYEQKGPFVGEVVLGHGDNEPGVSMLALAELPDFWHQGQKYGTQAALAMLDYAKATQKEGYTLDGGMLKRIEVTTRTDNVYSRQLIQKMEMTFLKTEELFGNQRHYYVKEV